MEKQITRGIRNNNPGNIRKSNDPWQGLSEVQYDPEFFQFKSMAYGVRAIARTLITYQDKYNIRTIKNVSERYAPSADNNDVVDYYMKVCAIAGIYDHNKVLNFHTYKDLEPVIRGIIYKENAPDHILVKQEDIDKGLMMAGVQPPKKSGAVSTTIVATSGISVAYKAITDNINEITPALPFIERIAQYWPWLAAGIMVAGLGYIIYEKIYNHKRGL